MNKPLLGPATEKGIREKGGWGPRSCPASMGPSRGWTWVCRSSIVFKEPRNRQGWGTIVALWLIKATGWRFRRGRINWGARGNPGAEGLIMQWRSHLEASHHGLMIPGVKGAIQATWGVHFPLPSSPIGTYQNHAFGIFMKIVVFGQALRKSLGSMKMHGVHAFGGLPEKKQKT